MINSSEGNPDYGTTREGAEAYTTDRVKSSFEQLIADEFTHYFHVVNLHLFKFVVPSVQQHRLLSLLKQTVPVAFDPK